MNTYYVEDVLCDYTCGMIVVKTENKEKALELINEAIAYGKISINQIEELKDNEVVMVYGGG